jgi:hypothetical protein
MDVNQMITSTSSATSSSNALEMIANQLNELKSKFDNKSSKSRKSKTNEKKSKVKPNEAKPSVTNDIQIPSCINRRINLVYGVAHHLTTKKQTKILKKWLDDLIVKMQLLANNEVDTDDSDDI